MPEIQSTQGRTTGFQQRSPLLGECDIQALVGIAVRLFCRRVLSITSAAHASPFLADTRGLSDNASAGASLSEAGWRSWLKRALERIRSVVSELRRRLTGTRCASDDRDSGSHGASGIRQQGVQHEAILRAIEQATDESMHQKDPTEWRAECPRLMDAVCALSRDSVCTSEVIALHKAYLGMLERASELHQLSRDEVYGLLVGKGGLVWIDPHLKESAESDEFNAIRESGAGRLGPESKLSIRMPSNPAFLSPYERSVEPYMLQISRNANLRRELADDMKRVVAFSIGELIDAIALENIPNQDGSHPKPATSELAMRNAAFKQDWRTKAVVSDDLDIACRAPDAKDIARLMVFVATHGTPREPNLAGILNAPSAHLAEEASMLPSRWSAEAERRHSELAAELAACVPSDDVSPWWVKQPEAPPSEDTTGDCEPTHCVLSRHE